MVLTWTLPVVLIPLIWVAARSDLIAPYVLNRLRRVMAVIATSRLIAAGLGSLV